MHFGYVQDDFKVSPKLTLNLGVRYEFATPQYDRDNHMANYDPATNSLVYAKDGSLADRALVNPSYKNFAPRARPGVQRHAEDRDPQPAMASATSSLCGRAATAISSYNGPFIVNAQVTQSPSQGLCAPNSTSLTCFRPTEQGYPAGLRVARELQHREHQDRLHPEGHPHAIRADLALHHSAGAGEGPGARRRVRGQSQRGPVGDGGPESGAPEPGGTVAAA